MEPPYDTVSDTTSPHFADREALVATGTAVRLGVNICADTGPPSDIKETVTIRPTIHILFIALTSVIPACAVLL